MPHRSITILGINDGHDSGAAIVRDGRILAALQEERLTNVKHDSGVPVNSIKTIFEVAKISPSEINAIAIVSLNRTYSPIETYPLKVRAFEKLSPFVHGKTFSKIYVRLLHRFRNITELKKTIVSLGIENTEIFFVEHHQCHAAAAYRTSPWGYDQPVLVMTCDGAGDGVSATVNIGDSGKITRLDWSTYYDSLGNAYYSEITRYLGMKPWDHEYKVMGLAPYGKSNYCIDKMRRIIKVNETNDLVFQNTFGAYLGSMQPGLKKLLAGERFDNIAAACQEYYEELFTRWVKSAIRKTGIPRVSFAGGNILNVKANKRVLELEDVNDAFFYPAAGDDGTPVGAALEVYYGLCIRDGIKPEHHELESLYNGPEYDDERVLEQIKAKGLLSKAEKFSSVDEVTGEFVAKGQIVARFSGRLEFGPRSLGNRSILADARPQKVVRQINTAIKQRDFWMPFAPTILEERVDDYLVAPRPARYMILSFDTTDKRDDLMAAMHPQDFTVRPQTLNDWNPGFRKVLSTFESITGVGGCLNTSFNLHGYPIAGTPELAFWTFENSGLDTLAIGTYIIRK